ncbi:MAG: hypothetical protein HS100_19850 [Anaerolineales bacterium]|nr:hypothetical protein [Anaerolineales bacterium]
MIDRSFSCPTCGGPNESIPGESRMACAYCGVNLIIPQELLVKAKPSLERKPPIKGPVPTHDSDAPDLLRKAQPTVIKAWNAYAYWTWIRWLFPTCLTILIAGFLVCGLFGVFPLISRLFR